MTIKEKYIRLSNDVSFAKNLNVPPTEALKKEFKDYLKKYPKAINGFRNLEYCNLHQMGTLNFGLLVQDEILHV